jgi:hypothetical protein
VASVYFFNFTVTKNVPLPYTKLTLQFVIGCAVVLFATYLYTKPERTLTLIAARSRVASAINLDEEGKIGSYDYEVPLKSANGRDLEA